MASTDIDGTPILILRPDKVRWLRSALRFISEIDHLVDEEQELLERLERFLEEVDG